VGLALATSSSTSTPPCSVSANNNQFSASTKLLKRIQLGVYNVMDGFGLMPLNYGAVAAALYPATNIRATNTPTVIRPCSVADIHAQLDPRSPAARIVSTSANSTTTNVLIAIYDLQSRNLNSTLTEITLSLAHANDPATGQYSGGQFSNIKLVAGNTTYYSASNYPLRFTNLSIPLNKNYWTPLQLIADIGPVSTQASASSTLEVNTVNIKAYDANFNPALVNGSASSYVGPTQLIVAPTVTFKTLPNSLQVSSASTINVTSDTEQSTTSAQGIFMFTLTNTSDNDQYISKYSDRLITTTSTNPPLGVNFGTVYPTIALPSDSPNNMYLVIPAHTSRTILLAVGMIDTNTTISVKDVRVTAIKYGNNPNSPTTNSITSGLQGLRLSASI
jgi:hypothetical protein